MGARRTTIISRVALLTTLYCFIVLTLRVAEGGALSLFLGHLGVEKLPYTFLAISLVDIPVAFVFMRLSRRMPNRLMLSALAVVLVSLLAGGRLLTGVHLGTSLFVSYMSATILTTFITIQWGVVLLDFFTVKESRRAFPLIYAGAHLGGLVAGLLLRHLARPLGTDNLIVWAPAAATLVSLALIAVSGRLREGHTWRQGERPAPADRSAVRGLKRLGLLRTSPLLAAIAASTAVMVLLRLTLRYTYGAGFEEAFPDPDDLARFVGTYTIAASLVGVALQVLAMPSLLARLGVGTMNVAYSVATSLTFVASALAPGLWTSAAARFTDQDLKSAIKTPLSAMFYEAMGQKRRADGRAIILGIVSPVSSFVSSLALVAVAVTSVPPVWVASTGIGLSLVFIVLSWLQGRAYDRELARELTERMRAETGDPDLSTTEAVRLALESDDRRLSDMARQVR